ncbi:TPA: hypothetical protein GF627_17330 [Escherichia coli]|nr:hypothetical protein [Escherichia coli]
MDIENYCTLRLFFNQSLVLDKVPEDQNIIAPPDIEMIREAILYRTKNTKAKTVMISNTIGITSTNVFKTNALYPHRSVDWHLFVSLWISMGGETG